MTSRSHTATSATTPAPSTPAIRLDLDLVRAASVRLMPASSPVIGRPDPAYAGAGR
jgi:hypothetical protein